MSSNSLSKSFWPCKSPASEQKDEITVDGMNTERFITSFTWNEAKFPARRPLRETVDKLSEGVARLEDELKARCPARTQLRHDRRREPAH